MAKKAPVNDAFTIVTFCTLVAVLVLLAISASPHFKSAAEEVICGNEG